jgi:hypothetical protein
MRVHDIILKCTAFIGHPSERGFVADGTCFVAYLSEQETDFYYIVTCAHVVWPERKDLPAGSTARPQGNVHIRFNRERKPPKAFPVARNDWVFPKDRWVDMCALLVDPFGPSADPDDEVDWAQINLEGLAITAANADQFGLSLGDEIFMPGAFVGRVGHHKNIPVVRIGHIAAMPDEPVENVAPRDGAYLVEIRSLGGFSGSPVFLNLDFLHGPNRRVFGPAKIIPSDGKTRSREVMIVPYKFLGMMLGSHKGRHAQDFISEDDTDIKLADAQFNGGIGVVLPAEQIIHFLREDPDLKETREAAIKAKKTEGYHAVPTSSHPSKPEPPTMDENLSHKEDFTRLLDVAVRRPQSDGQT